MLPNTKKDLHGLKSDFDDSGVNRITPKILRDFIVSVFSSRNPRKIMDSQNLDENDDLLIVDMDEGGNYVKLPARFETDDSGTPFVNQKYTIINVGAYRFDVVTEPTDLFHTKKQSITVGIGEVIEFVATPDYWVFYSGGVSTPNGGLVGFPATTKCDVLDNRFVVVDSVPMDEARTIKWTVSQKTSNASRTSEILVNVGNGNVDSCEFGILGDDIDADLSVIVNGTNAELKVNNQSGDALNMVVLRVVLA